MEFGSGLRVRRGDKAAGAWACNREERQVLVDQVDSLVFYGADRQISLECRNFLLKPRDPIIETLHRRRLKRLDYPVKSAQTRAPSCTGSRWRLYCSHILSRKLSGNRVLARTNQRDSHKRCPWRIRRIWRVG